MTIDHAQYIRWGANWQHLTQRTVVPSSCLAFTSRRGFLTFDPYNPPQGNLGKLAIGLSFLFLFLFLIQTKVHGGQAPEDHQNFKHNTPQKRDPRGFPQGPQLF